jgi:RNA polymerase sigma factor for flagellar operon FliA
MPAPVLDQGEIDRLWDRYKADGAAGDRDTLVRTYLPLVKIVVRKLAPGLPRSVDRGDLVSYGNAGLLDAIEKFRPDRGLKFGSYATVRIRGACLDGLRSSDCVPRSVRAKARALAEAETELQCALGRAPTDAELARELAVSEAQLQRMSQQASSTGTASLDAETGDQDGGLTLGASLAARSVAIGSGDDLEDLKQILAGAINRLGDREKIVLALCYYEGLTFNEIGEVLGVTESRVCQIHTAAVLEMGVHTAPAAALAP